MGGDEADRLNDRNELRIFMKRLLTDLRALEQLLAGDRIESGSRRIGAEQELFLVDRGWRPAPVADKVLRTLDDPHFTNELARFNMEFNLDPTPFGDRCLSRMESDLNSYLRRARAAARSHDAEAILAGILPTIRPRDLTLENMTPNPRYDALNEAVSRLRGSNAYDLRVVGIDELSITHDSIMIEACNTSFQVHFQISRDEFVEYYNIGQAVAGPTLAASTNSPILFGKRLWEETRIAIFQQALETRRSTADAIDRVSRVTFGTKWVEDSVIDIFQEDIARMRVLLGGDAGADPFDEIAEDRAPELRALQLHNGNRFLPSGPTVIDEVANAALWFGLVSGMRAQYGDVTPVMEFDVAKANFVAAARHGLSAQFQWIGGKTVPAHELLQQELIPLARDGLKRSGIDSDDIQKYLDVIEARVRADTTGSRWMLRSMAAMKGRGSDFERLAAIASACARHQEDETPVHDWPEATLADAGGWEANYLRAEQYMTTDVFTVHEDELMDLAACMMDWAQIRHIPVEDDNQRLVGLVSYRSLLRVLAKGIGRGKNEHVAVRDIMNPDPITISPETSTLDAIRLMKENGVACLPVVRDGRLLGLVTERHFMGVAAELLEEKLRDR